MDYTFKIETCPNCGKTLNSFVAECPYCHIEIRRRGRDNGSIDDLMRQLQQIDEEFAKNPVKDSDGDIDDEALEKRKVDAIRYVVVPTTREDLLHFATTAYSQVQSLSKFGDEDLFNAWHQKLNEAIEKIELLFPGDQTMMNLVSRYKSNVKKRSITTSFWFGLGIFLLVDMILLVALTQCH